MDQAPPSRFPSPSVRPRPEAAAPRARVDERTCTAEPWMQRLECGGVVGQLAVEVRLLEGVIPDPTRGT
jgi:hypothetical protein